LEALDALARAPARQLELRLARAAPADAAGEARHHRVLLDEARQRVLELRQLDLKLAVAALRALGEDVEDEHRAVDDLEVGEVADRARLTRAEIGIEDEELRAELHGADDHVAELAVAQEVLGIGLGAALLDDLQDLDPRRARQLAQLGDAPVGIGAPP